MKWILCAMAKKGHLYLNENIYSLQTLWNKTPFRFPVVVKPIETDYEVPDQLDLPDDDLLLCRVKNVNFVHVKVLPFVREADAKIQKGESFVNQRNQYVGKDFLLPARYKGTLRFVTRPGIRQRFTSIAQIIDNPPRYVRVEETVRSNADGKTLGEYVPEKTILEVKSVLTENKNRFLVCATGQAEYKFKDTNLVNFTAVKDRKSYTLSETQAIALCPACVQFEMVPPNDVSFLDDNEALMMHTIVGGPLEVLDFPVTAVLAILFKSKTDNERRIVIVPEALHSKMEVKIEKSSTQMTSFTREHFQNYHDHSTIRTSLYAINFDPKEQNKLIWLRQSITEEQPSPQHDSPPPVPRRPKPKSVAKQGPVSHPTPPSTLNLPKSPPPPPLLQKPSPPVPRPPLQTQTSVELPIPIKCKEDRMRKWKEKAKLGFGKVHDELLKRFSTKPSPQNEAASPEKEYNPIVVRPAAMKNRPLPKIPCDLSANAQTEIEEYEQVTEKVDDYEPMDGNNKNSKDYFLEDLNKICRDNQGSEDFYSYTVSEVFHCFHMCCVENLAQLCREQKLDGQFFKGFDLNDFKEDPFNLDAFSALKVKKIIFEGWRPRLLAEK